MGLRLADNNTTFLFKNNTHLELDGSKTYVARIATIVKNNTHLELDGSKTASSVLNFLDLEQYPSRTRWV